MNQATMTKTMSFLFISTAALAGYLPVAAPFVMSPPLPHSRISLLSQSSEPFEFEDALELERFQRRHQAIKQSKQPLPPHPTLAPKEVVQTLLDHLRQWPQFYDYDTSRPHPGVETLWSASTEEWQATMAAIVGANSSSSSSEPDEIIVPALGRFLARPDHQFAILLGVEDDNYWIDFPTDVLEWSDEEAWLECRLRDGDSDELLVVLGWTLTREDARSAWYIHSFDWQDFRNAYRPGIGREEWERICG